MDPRKQKKEATRQRLLTVTAQTLASGRSFDTLSLREVAKLAGIPPTSFYRHFHDLDDLGLALIEEHRKALFALMERVRGQVSDGRSLIRASVEAVYEFIADNQGVSRMIVQESMSPESPFREASAGLFLAMARRPTLMKSAIDGIASQRPHVPSQAAPVPCRLRRTGA